MKWLCLSLIPAQAKTAKQCPCCGAYTLSQQSTIYSSLQPMSPALVLYPPTPFLEISYQFSFLVQPQVIKSPDPIPPPLNDLLTVSKLNWTSRPGAKCSMLPSSRPVKEHHLFIHHRLPQIPRLSQSFHPHALPNNRGHPLTVCSIPWYRRLETSDNKILYIWNLLPSYYSISPRYPFTTDMPKLTYRIAGYFRGANISRLAVL